MNIIKYNSSKDSTNARTGDNTTVINGGTPSGGNSESASKLAETHSIFGQPFDGTQDVSGDITNVQNITAVGGDVVVKSLTDSEGEFGGNIQADKDILAGGDMKVTGDAYATKFIGDIEANEGTVTSISGTSLNYDNANIRQAIIDTLQSTDITTENLTVTKQAHFFELIIDKIKAAGGAVILSPADGFKVDKVSTTSSGYRVYWKATDGEKSISNMWKVNDQAICQTFNAATGTSYNVSNKYYWSLVTAVGTESINGTDYHYLDLSRTTVDGTLNPEVGDEIAMLGYRGTDDSNRQSAIYIAAYNSIDSELKAPLFAHYRGINDFNLKAHKYTWFAANGNTIKGNLLIESGQTVEEYVEQHSPEGATQYYKMLPVIERAEVGSSGTLYVNFRYQIVYVKGNTSSTITASSSGYKIKVRPNNSNTYYTLSYSSSPAYTNTSFLTNYHTASSKPTYFTVYLYDASGVVKDRRIVTVVFNAAATLTITDSIQSTVSGHTSSINTLNSNVSTLTNSVSSVTQKADRIESTVTSISNGIIGDNVLAGIGNGMYWTGYTKFEEAGFTFTFGSDEYLVSPVFQDHTGTYTLSFGSWTGTIKAEIYDFATQYVTGDNPDFSTGTKIAEISTADVDNTNPAKMHYDSTLGRYYFTFNESSSSSRTFRIRLSTTSTENYIQKIMVESGSVPHVFNEAFAYNQSQIKQTANEIELKVNDISIRLNNGIELNGDTKVNGSLTLTDADQGFILNGGSGKTVISPQSIGSFYGFQNIANTISRLYASTSEFGSNTLTNTVIFNFTKTFSIGTVPSGKTVTLSNGAVSFMKTYSSTVISPSSINVKYKIYQGSTLKNTYSSSATSMATMGTTTISSTDEVKITIEVKMTCLNSYWTTDSSKPIEMPLANCSMGIQVSVPNDAFALIGYDGIGLNFGGNGIIYLGQSMCQLQYGSNAVRIDANGIYKYCGPTSSSNKSHIIDGTTYTDTATSYYQQEYAPLNGYKIRRVTTSGNVYADLSDEYILCRHSSGTVNIMLGIPSYFTGKCVKIKSVDQDVNVYAGTSTSNTSYKIVRSDGSKVNSREQDNNACRSYWSDGNYWYEEFLGW